MKLAIVGLGQCGSRLAEEFARLNNRARIERGVEVTAGVFAVDTDAADLVNLTAIECDYCHRILMGVQKTGGHGTGNINELGTETAKQDSDRIIDAIRSDSRFYKSHAFLLIAAAAGGAGSGALPVITKAMKERYTDKPVFNLVILPFAPEESMEPRFVYNTVACLKSAISVANAVILADNERYAVRTPSLRNDLLGINRSIVEGFYDLLCAGEERKAEYIGARTLDAGEIIQTVTGWTAIGHGKSLMAAFSFPVGSSDFIKKSTQTDQGIRAIDEAIGGLSVGCTPADATKALYLLSAPVKEMTVELATELGDYLKRLAPRAVIRRGDYPRKKGVLSVSVILSGLSQVERVTEYYAKSVSLTPEFEKKEENNKV